MNKNSPHILNTSSNLLGFTFLVLTSMKGFGITQGSFIGEIISLCVALFALSSFFSFSSMHIKSGERIIRYETIASYIFLSGLFAITIISVLLAFDIIILKK